VAVGGQVKDKRVSTTRADGRPHVSPLVAVWADDALHFPTAPPSRKLNLQASPDVVLTTGPNSWEEGLDVVVEGTARRVLGRTDLARLAAAWARKWDGRWQYEVADRGLAGGEHGTVHVFAVHPAQLIAFGKNHFHPHPTPVHQAVAERPRPELPSLAVFLAHQPPRQIWTDRGLSLRAIAAGYEILPDGPELPFFGALARRSSSSSWLAESLSSVFKHFSVCHPRLCREHPRALPRLR
jgi:hypothetical protein